MSLGLLAPTSLFFFCGEDMELTDADIERKRAALRKFTCCKEHVAKAGFSSRDLFALIELAELLLPDEPHVVETLRNGEELVGAMWMLRQGLKYFEIHPLVESKPKGSIH
jgi:hypothetical protein